MVLPNHGYDWGILPNNNKPYEEADSWLKQKLVTIDQMEFHTTTY
jgi:hypothetical protein